MRYDPSRVHGHVLSRQVLHAQLEHLRTLPLEERQRVRGVHPDRALVIVPGLAILLAAIDAFRLHEVTVSEHDILLGAAIGLARPARHAPAAERRRARSAGSLGSALT